MKKGFLIAGPLMGLMAAGLACGPARAEQVKIEVNQDGAVIEVPASVPRITTFSPGVVPTSVQADDIVAHEVRAQTIYANKIESPSVQGTIHQSDTVKIDKTKGDIETPSVTAGVIYADTIKARSVVADNIYVRELKKN